MHRSAHPSTETDHRLVPSPLGLDLDAEKCHPNYFPHSHSLPDPDKTNGKSHLDGFEVFQGTPTIWPCIVFVHCLISWTLCHMIAMGLRDTCSNNDNRVCTTYRCLATLESLAKGTSPYRGDHCKPALQMMHTWMQT